MILALGYAAFCRTGPIYCQRPEEAFFCKAITTILYSMREEENMALYLVQHGKSLPKDVDPEKG